MSKGELSVDAMKSRSVVHFESRDPDTDVFCYSFDLTPAMALLLARKAIDCAAELGVTPDWPEWKP